MVKKLEKTVFSEYEVKQLNCIFGTGENAVVGTIDCLGNLEEESEVRSMIKRCRGVTNKKRTWGTGSGTLKATMHVPWALYVKMMGMEDESLASGVYGYGRYSKHPEFTLTADVFDEDDVEKLKAWPKCTASTGPARKVENGAEEVAEIEAEIGFAPDEYGVGVYEALAADITDKAIVDAWLEAFTPELVRVPKA